MDKYQRIDKKALIIQSADYCILYGWSVREIAENMMISKTTIHRWLTEDLKYINNEKYEQCKRILKDRSNSKW